jgi:hypothetical protein
MRERAVAAAGAGMFLALLAGACSSGPPVVAPTPSTTSTVRGCPPTSLSGGPVTSQVVVVTTAASSAPTGSVLAVRTEIVVLSDAPAMAARPQWSALEVLGRGAVVARAVGTAGPDVATPLPRGTTMAAPTVPTSIRLSGCDGTPLAPGAYRLRALVGYRSDALTDAPSGFAMVSEPVDLTVT